ncbi:hypothetical protein [Nocardia amamiensis]|uniref:hypothetical protein n=1 Tax=Nocardia amamiensis TaxID=404578 RepID=UPI000835BBA2|nr:hypothetical protein [Nocardia amamiensis]
MYVKRTTVALAIAAALLGTAHTTAIPAAHAAESGSASQSAPGPNSPWRNLWCLLTGQFAGSVQPLC